MLSLLRTDPERVTTFSDLWVWSEWQGREGRPDTGNDIVAKHRRPAPAFSTPARHPEAPGRSLPSARVLV